MRRSVISVLIMGLSLMLVSCSNVEGDSAKYPIDEYLAKGASFVEYLPSGAAVMNSASGVRFFASPISTYEVRLNNSGELMPMMIVNGVQYFYDLEEISDSAPAGLKSGKISVYSGDHKVITGEEVRSMNYTNGVEVLYNKEDDSIIYVLPKNGDKYQVWRKA